MRRLYVINPAAGGGRGLARWERLSSRLRTRGLDGPHRVTSSPQEAADVAADSAGTYETVVAVGGDGTAGAVATGLARHPDRATTMAVFPVGSGNDAATMAGTPTIEAALEALGGGFARSFDGIEVTFHDGQRMARWMALTFAGTGFAADILEAAGTAWKRLLGGPLAYGLGFIRALRRYRPDRVRVTWEGEAFAGDTVAVVAANHTHAGGRTMHIGPGAVADDGRFDASIIQSVGRFEMVRQFMALTRGRHVRHPAVMYFRTAEMAIDASAPVRVVTDGEILGWTPASFRIRPGAIRMIVAPSRFPMGPGT